MSLLSTYPKAETMHNKPDWCWLTMQCFVRNSFKWVVKGIPGFLTCRQLRYIWYNKQSNQHTPSSICVWCQSVSERCCMDCFSLQKLHEWALVASDISTSLWLLFYSPPIPSIFFTLSIPYTTPTHPLNTSHPFRRWKELHQTSSCSRAKCPSTTLNSPGYLKPLPPASLTPLSPIFVLTSSIRSFSASVSTVSHCRCFISEGAFSLIS